ncbi:MAG: class I SAM-dependent methyltransferase [Novosphingobium sp.]
MRGSERSNGMRGLVTGLRNAYAAKGRGLPGALLYRLWPHPQLTMLQPALDGRIGPRRDKSVRILDVGCGAGRLLRDLRDAGFANLTGIDPFLAEPSDDGNLRLLRSDVTEHEGAYDVITFNHSLEHVVDPRAALAAAKGLLAPGGVIIVRVPLVDSQAWRIYGGEWGQLDAPRHLYLFTRKGLASLASGAGCDLVRTQDDSNEVQFVLSELRLRGVRFHEIDTKSAAAQTFPPEQIADFKRRAAAFNAAGEGDQAAFYLTARKAA